VTADPALAPAPAPRRGVSLLVRAAGLVLAIVLVLGAAIVLWITAEDRREALLEADRLETLAETELRDLATTLVRDHQDIAVSLVEGADARTRDWLDEEPLGLHREPGHPERVDVDALRRALRAEVLLRSRREADHVRIVADRLGHEADARVDRVAAALRAEATARAEAAAAERRARLSTRLALLLAGLAAILAIALWRFVLAPVARLRGAVARIAAGDLATPVGPDGARGDEIGSLARDVESMRGDLRVAREGLEAEVARKTADLERSLSERTAALDELRRTQERLVQAAKMASLGTLAGGIAHEFNNLLGGIRACAEEAAAGNRDASVAEDLAMIRRTADRGASLVRGVLEVARPGDRAMAPVELASLVDDAIRTAAPAAERRRVQIRRESSPVPPVWGDAAQLHQVALNLVTNALQAVDDGEPVVVAVRREGDRAVLEVRDGGPGVDPALRDRIFEPFFTGKEGGTGLGLFVSYGIVERHGGTIEVGTAPEGGARFTVRLPLSAEPPRSGTGLATSPPAGWNPPSPSPKAP
jgi:signal transduction histidine kinase